jgi:hypothetical protein
MEFLLNFKLKFYFVVVCIRTDNLAGLIVPRAFVEIGCLINDRCKQRIQLRHSESIPQTWYISIQLLGSKEKGRPFG